MTEFRSKGKGKDRKVYPMKRQPYGVSRKLALEEVQALRQGGKRARLIKTSQTRDLYAPYEGIMPPSMVSPQPSGIPEDKTVEPSTGPIQPPAESMLSAAETSKKALELAKRYKLDPTAITKKGKNYAMVMDASRTFLVWEELPAGSDRIPGLENIGNKVVPALEYQEGKFVGINFSAETGNALYASIKEVVNSLGTDDRFYFDKHNRAHKYNISDLNVTIKGDESGKHTYAVVMPGEYYKFESGEDIGKYTRVVRLDSYGDSRDLDVSYDASLLMKTLKVYQSLSSRKQFYMAVKSDYPVTVSGNRNPDLGNDLPVSGAMLAPKMEDQNLEGVARKAISGVK